MKRIALCFVLLAFTGCAAPNVAQNWHKVEIGMAKEEVLDLLGKPDSTSSRRQIQDKGKRDGTKLTLEAGLRRSGSAYVALIHRAEERWRCDLQADLTGSIYFDGEGRVLNYMPRQIVLKYTPGEVVKVRKQPTRE